MLIGVTGGIGAGKSRVASALAARLDARLLSADRICRELLDPGEPGFRAVLERWGDRFLGPDGRLDRTGLREAVFGDGELRRGLETILHPQVRCRVQAAARAAGAGLVIAEVPLLFEAGWQEDFDLIVAVYAPEAVALGRVAERDRTPIEAVRAIVAVQMAPETKRDRADFVVDNSAGWGETEEQITSLAAVLRRRLGTVSGPE